MQTYCNLRNCDNCREKASLKVLSYYTTKDGERKCSENNLYCMAHAFELAAKDFENISIGWTTFTEMRNKENLYPDPDDKVIPIPEKEVSDSVGECFG